MNDETWIRTQVRRILIEEAPPEEEEKKEEEEPKPGETTTGPGPGRFKKELKNLKALADVDPQQLMKNLGVSGAAGDTPAAILTNLLSRPIRNNEMGGVYKNVKAMEDAYERDGVQISITGKLSVRDALIFMRETVKGAQKAGMLPVKEDIQVEILGDSILAYLSEKPFRWNKKKRR